MSNNTKEGIVSEREGLKGTLFVGPSTFFPIGKATLNKSTWKLSYESEHKVPGCRLSVSQSEPPSRKPHLSHFCFS